MTRRKRAVSDLLSDNKESMTTRSSRKSRVVSRILNEESEELTPTTPTHERRMEICNCSKCRGKLVDIRTKISHDVEDDQDSPQENTNPLPLLEDIFSENLKDDDDEPAIQQMDVEETEDLPDNLTRRRPKKYINRQTTARLPEFSPRMKN